jgi:hypothetical protein
MLLAALVAAVALATPVDAAGKKVVRHRAKHSTRVSSGTTTPATKGTAKKKTSRKSTTPAAKSTNKSTAKKKPTTKPQ